MTLLQQTRLWGTRAEQPAPYDVVVSTLYFVTDEGKLEISDGSYWLPYSLAGAGTGDINSNGAVAFAADQSMGGNKLTDLADPDDPQDAASKAYVDASAGLLGAWVLLEEHSASASANLSFTTRNKNGLSGASFQSDFDVYVLQLIGLLPASNDVNCRLRWSTNGGSSYDASALYTQSFKWAASNNSDGKGGSTGNTYADMGGNVNSSTTGGINSEFRIYQPLSTTKHKRMQGQSNFLHTTIGEMDWTRLLTYVQAAAVNAFRIDMVAASGGAAVNIASGTGRLFGVKVS